MKTISQVLTELGLNENSPFTDILNKLNLVTVDEINNIKSISVKPLPNVVRDKGLELKDRLVNTVIDDEKGSVAVMNVRYALLYKIATYLNDYITTEHNTNITQNGKFDGYDTSISNINTLLQAIGNELYNDSTFATNNDHNGLHYIVKTDHEGRITALEEIDAESRLSELENDEVRHLELSSTSGTLSASELEKANRTDCIIEVSGKMHIRNKVVSTDDTALYENYEPVYDSTNHIVEFNCSQISINTETGAYSITTSTMNLLTTGSVENSLTSSATNRTLSAAQGKALKEMIDGINTLLASDDTSLDQLQEIVTYIKNNKDLIDGITSSKVSVSDIISSIEALADTQTDKPLSASIGYYLLNLITSINNAIGTDITSGTIKGRIKVNEASIAGINTEIGSDNTSGTIKGRVSALETGKADKSNTYTKTQVDAIIEDLTIEGYEMSYERLVEIFNDAFATDPVVTALNELNGEVV